MLKKISRYVLFLSQRLKLRKRDVYIPFISFSRNTTFEGKNEIGFFSKLSDSTIGFGTYIGGKVFLDNTIIGRFCSIGNDIRIHCGQHPTDSFVSTSPSFYSPNNSSLKKTKLVYTDKLKFNREREFTRDGKSLEIGNDVWIGNEARFIEGVKVHDGAIVGSGALVTKDVPPYAIVGGVPAKIIRHRFSEEQIKYLLELKWWDKEEEWLKKNAKFFTELSTLMANIKND